MTLDLHHDFTLNPDGSGRVVVRWTGPQEGAPSPDEFVRTEIEQAQGVEAWDGVRCAIEDERLVFTGTAFFRDLRALRFHCQGVHVNLADLELLRAGDGSVEVRTRFDRAEHATAGGDASTERLADAREQIRQARAFIAGLFGGLSCTLVVRLPGRLAGPVRGRRCGDNAVEATFRGACLVDLLDRLLVDDALMGRLLAAGGLQGPAALYELLGDDAAFAARTMPGAQAQFDYEQEVATARESFAALRMQLRAATPGAGPAVPLDNVRIIAARVVREADGGRDLCPQGQSATGVTVTIAADLPQSALELERAVLEKAVTDDGCDVTPPDEWDRQCHFPKTTADGQTIYLDFALPAGAGARGLAELTARVTATTSHGREEIELGLPELTAGARGRHLGAELLRCEAEADGGMALELRLDVPRPRVIELSALVGRKRVPLTIQGWSSCSDECSLACRVDEALPADARLVATLATDLERADYALALRAVDWFGHGL